MTGFSAPQRLSASASRGYHFRFGVRRSRGMLCEAQFCLVDHRQQVVYDNLKPAVARILQGHRRTEQEAFAHFRSVYLFEAVFANPHAGWEKGSVENLVGYARRTYLVPIPQVPGLQALNRWLRQQCLADQGRIMAGRDRSIAALLDEERAQLGPLPAHAPEIGEVREVVVRSTSHVPFQTNEYSVPVRYAENA